MPCGLPMAHARLNTGIPGATIIPVFNLSSDCVIARWMGSTGDRFLHVEQGEYTINGNGYTITGPPNFGFLSVSGPGGGSSGASLHLNNVTIRGFGNSETILAGSGAIVTARDVTFKDGLGGGGIGSILQFSGPTDLRNIQVLDNGSPASGRLIITSSGSGAVTITNSVFRGNIVQDTFGVFNVIAGSIQITCSSISGNVYPDGSAANISRVWPAGSFKNIPCPKKKRKEDPTAVPTATPRPQIAATHVALQAATGATFRTTFGLDSGVHFRQLDGAGIGIQSIIDAGYLEAFDVWGYVEQGVEVCFPQIGRVVFLDANTSPRAIVPLESTVANGQTCVSINSPGSLVLLPN